MFLVQCEELRINHLTLLLVVTMSYARWFLWRAYYIKDLKWRLRFQFGVAFRRVVWREVYFGVPNRTWRALKTSILTIGLKGLILPIAGNSWMTAATSGHAPSRLTSVPRGCCCFVYVLTLNPKSRSSHNRLKSCQSRASPSPTSSCSICFLIHHHLMILLSTIEEFPSWWPLPTWL